MPSGNSKKQPGDQASKFKAAAKEAGAEMSEADFKRSIKKVAKSPPAKCDKSDKDEPGK